jgi:hypothetical protein
MAAPPPKVTNHLQAISFSSHLSLHSPTPCPSPGCPSSAHRPSDHYILRHPGPTRRPLRGSYTLRPRRNRMLLMLLRARFRDCSLRGSRRGRSLRRLSMEHPVRCMLLLIFRLIVLLGTSWRFAFWRRECGRDWILHMETLQRETRIIVGWVVSVAEGGRLCT